MVRRPNESQLRIKGEGSLIDWADLERNCRWMPRPNGVSDDQGLNEGSAMAASAPIRPNIDLIDVTNFPAKLVGPIRNQQRITFDAAVQLQYQYSSTHRVCPQFLQRVSNLVNSHWPWSRVFPIERQAHANDQIILARL